MPHKTIEARRAYHKEYRRTHAASLLAARRDARVVVNAKQKIYYQKTYPNSAWGRMLNAARFRAKQSGLQFNLTKEWSKSVWTGHCAVSGIKFSRDFRGAAHPFSPSIDKIIPELGYIQKNCRFVLWGINAMKGSCGGDFEINTIAKAIVKKQQEAGDERWQ